MARSLSYTVLLNDAPPPETVTRSIKQIEIERDVNTASMIRLNLTIAVDEAGRGWTMIDDGTFDYLTKISILTTTKIPIPQPLVTGYVIDVKPQRSSTPGQSEVEIVAMDAEVFLRSEEVVRRCSNMSDSTVAENVFVEHGLAPSVQRTTNQRDERHTATIQSRTDGSLLDELANRNGYEFRVEPNGPTLPEFGNFREPGLELPAQDTLKINLGVDSNAVGFSVQDSRQSASAATAGTVDSRTIQPLVASSNRTSQRILGAESFDTSPATETILPSRGLVDPGELQKLVQSHVDDSNWAITATGTCSVARYGDIIRIGQPIDVIGAGQADSGTYYVTAVTYMFAQRDMAQNFTLKRNARGHER